MAQIRQFKNSKISRNPEATETKKSGLETLKTFVSTSGDSTHITPNSLMQSSSSPAGNTPLPSPLRKKGRMVFVHVCHRCSNTFGELDERCGSCNHSRCPRCPRQPIDSARHTDAQNLSSIQSPSLTSYSNSAFDSTTHDLGGTNVNSPSTKGPSHLALPVITEEYAPNYLRPPFLNETYLSTNHDPFMGASQEVVSWEENFFEDSELAHDVTLSYGSTLDVDQTSGIPPVDYVSPHQTKPSITSEADYTPKLLPRRTDLPHSGVHSEIALPESQNMKSSLTKPLSSITSQSMTSQSKSARRSRSRSLRSDISSLVNRLSKHSLGEREGIKDVLGRFSSSTLSSRSASMGVIKGAQSRTEQPLVWRLFKSGLYGDLDLPGDFILSNINTFGVRHVACGFGGARPLECQPYFCEGCLQRLLPQSERNRYSVARAVIDAKCGNRIGDSWFYHCSPHWSDVFGNTALHVAAALGASIKTLVRMIDSGASVKQTNTANQTFLHVLNHSTPFDPDDSFVLVQVLKAKDFDFGHIDVQGQTILGPLIRCQLEPLDFARNWVIQLLQFDIDRALSIHNYTFVRRVFKTAGGTDEQWTKAGWFDSFCLPCDLPWSPDSMKLRDLGMERIALESYPQRRHFTDTTGRNLLHIAVDPFEKPNSRYALVEMFLINKVDANHFDESGETPLMAHIRGSEDPTIMTLLIENGAKVDSRNRLGEAALHLSIKLGKIPITRALLSYRFNQQERFSGRWVNVHARNCKGEGVLAVGEIAQRQARANPGLYAKIAACKALAMDAGAIADPDLFQEWGLDESEHSRFWPIPSGRSTVEQHAIYY